MPIRAPYMACRWWTLLSMILFIWKWSVNPKMILWWSKPRMRSRLRLTTVSQRRYYVFLLSSRILFVLDACEEQITPFIEEAEEKINLFDVFNEGPEKENKDPFHNSTLIITTDEHLDATTCDETLNTSTETVKNVNTSMNNSATSDVTFKESKTNSAKPKLKKEDHSHFWVSNISRHVKATDLKKLFSQMGKVVTVKILTNGKNYFGYVSVDSSETAGKCIRQLNNALFDGKRIIVSKDRPDMRETKQIIKLESRKRSNEKLEYNKENKTVESMVAEEKHIAKRNKPSEEEEAKNNIIADLRNKLDRFKAEISRYKWKIVEYQRRHEGMRKKCGNLEKELKEIQYKIRADRRKLNQDRELFEKNKKMDLIRLEADKAVINKELIEVKKLREHLKAKIEEIKAQAKKTPKRRSRSPLPVERSRSPRARSPPLRIGSRMGYRSEERTEKKRKRDDLPRGRTPPPPPKLSNGVGKKRNEKLSHRQYFEDVEKRSSLDHGHGYEYRHKPSFTPSQDLNRSPWQVSYSKDPRRMNATTSGGQSYPPDPRYGGGYQFPPSTVAVAPRSYYPEFNKLYGHY